MRPPDVLVIGGGPAGATVAALTAGAGARVLLLERERLPRDKVCGEFVSAAGCEVLRELGVLPRLSAAGATRIDACRFTGAGGRIVDLPLPASLGVSRRLLDLELLELARRRGAVVRERVVAHRPLVEDGLVRGVRACEVGRAGDGEEIRAGVVVAADGRRSVLARGFSPGRCDPRRSGPGSWFGIKTHLEVDGDPLGGRVELHVFDGGYVGLATVEGGLVNLCALVTVRALRACGSPDGVLTGLILRSPSIARLLDGARRASRWKSVGPLRFGVRRPTAPGVLFVGDAAGTIDPFCGEGIANALRGAVLAARHALAGTDGGAYGDDWLRSFGPGTARARLLGGIIGHPRVAGAALAVVARIPRLPERLAAAARTF